MRNYLARKYLDARWCGGSGASNYNYAHGGRPARTAAPNVSSLWRSGGSIDFFSCCFASQVFVLLLIWEYIRSLMGEIQDRPTFLPQEDLLWYDKAYETNSSLSSLFYFNAPCVEQVYVLPVGWKGPFASWNGPWKWQTSWVLVSNNLSLQRMYFSFFNLCDDSIHSTHKINCDDEFRTICG